MSELDDVSVEEALEECVDELDRAILSLNRFHDTIIAYALRAHLSALLSALLEHDLCTPGDAREFLTALECEVLEPGRAFNP